MFLSASEALSPIRMFLRIYFLNCFSHIFDQRNKTPLELRRENHMLLDLGSDGFPLLSISFSGVDRYPLLYS
jgi:hypothetical protein